MSALPETIVSEGDTSRQATGPLVMGLLFGVMGGLMVLGGTMTDAGLGLAIPGGIVLLVAVGFVWGAVGSLRIASRLDPGVLDVPHRTFYMGSEVPCRFRRLVKRGTPQVRSAEVRLVLREWVRYTVGTDTRTATEEVQVIPLPATPTTGGREVLIDLVLPIPVGAPTFEASNNTVRWCLEVDLEFADGFSEDSIVPLWVVPAVLGGTP